MIYIVVGTRPNFMKVSPLINQLKINNIEFKLIHTGQHFDKNMSDIFFKELNIPEPDINLNIHELTDIRQIAHIMMTFELLCKDERPDLIIVVGDVNSTYACALVASSLQIPLAHIESGFRSFDMRMPEERNRVLTDHLSDYLFCSDEECVRHLWFESIRKHKIHLVGDLMIDALLQNIDKIKPNTDFEEPYILVTIHRTLNVDNKKNLEIILKSLNFIKKENKIKIVFPLHPRTKKRIKEFDLESYLKDLNIIEPVGYLEFLSLLKSCKTIVTDSGGIQIEALVLEKPCITLRTTTERLFTLENGNNILCNIDDEDIIDAIKTRINGFKVKRKNDLLWDGKTAERIVKILFN